MRWYTLPGWPARVLGHAAAMPGMTRPPGSAHAYKDGTTGHPGTARAPVPGPGVPTGPIGEDGGDSGSRGRRMPRRSRSRRLRSSCQTR